MNGKEKELERFVASGEGIKITYPNKKKVNNLSKIKKISFQRFICLWTDGNTDFTIEFNDDGTSKVENMCFARYDNETLNKDISTKIYKKLKKIEIENWKRKYESKYPVCDGESWYIKLEYTDGKRKYRKGINAYPDNFEELEKLLEYIKKQVAIVKTNREYIEKIKNLSPEEKNKLYYNINAMGLNNKNNL